MAELITEEQPRIKFQLIRDGTFSIPSSEELMKLSSLMKEMEEWGACPILNDGKVGGNCAIKLSHIVMMMMMKKKEGASDDDQVGTKLCSSMSAMMMMMR